MEEMGMTDMQFKSFLKQLIRNLEDAKGEEGKEETDEKLSQILQDLKEDLQN